MLIWLVRCAIVCFLLHLPDSIHPLNNIPTHHFNLQPTFTATEKQKSSIFQTNGTQSITKIRLAEKTVIFKDKCYKIQKFSLKQFSPASIQMELLGMEKKICDISLINLYGWFKWRNLRNNISFSSHSKEIFRAGVISTLAWSHMVGVITIALNLAKELKVMANSIEGGPKGEIFLKECWWCGH